MKMFPLHTREAIVDKETQPLNGEKSVNYFYLYLISYSQRTDVGFICHQVKKVLGLGKV